MKRSLFLFLATLVSAANAADLVLQNGRNGYQDTADVTLVGHPEKNGELNFGGMEWIRVAGVPQGGLRQLGLIRFDGIAERLPKRAKIKAAYLELYKTGEPKDTGQYAKVAQKDLAISLYGVLRPWKSGTGKGKSDPTGATFTTRGANGEGMIEYWGEANQIETGPVRGVDFTERELSRAPLQPNETGLWMRWNITPLAQEWVANPASNHGVLLMARSYYVGSYFASSEAQEAEFRPRLIIEY